MIHLRACDLMDPTQLLGFFLITDRTNKKTHKGLKALTKGFGRKSCTNSSNRAGGHEAILSMKFLTCLHCSETSVTYFGA